MRAREWCLLVGGFYFFGLIRGSAVFPKSRSDELLPPFICKPPRFVHTQNGRPSRPTKNVREMSDLMKVSLFFCVWSKCRVNGDLNASLFLPLPAANSMFGLLDFYALGGAAWAGARQGAARRRAQMVQGGMWLLLQVFCLLCARRVGRTEDACSAVIFFDFGDVMIARSSLARRPAHLALRLLRGAKDLLHQSVHPKIFAPDSIPAGNQPIVCGHVYLFYGDFVCFLH